jgi:hypothetical protein
MVDPFFQKVNKNIEQESWQAPAQQSVSKEVQSSSPVNSKLNDVLRQQQVQQVLQQQKLLEEQYNQLGTLLQNPKLLDEQKKQIYQQAQELSLQYQENNKKLETLWYNPNQVSKPNEVKNTSWFKLSLRWFLLGCFLLLIVLIGGLLAIFYYLTQNPDQLTNLGLDVMTTIQLLQVFGSVFFWLIVFLAVWIMVVNWYRLITVKNQSKIWYWFWLILWIILFLWWIVLWSTVIEEIRKISLESDIDKNKLLSTYVYIMDSDPKPDWFTGFRYISTSIVEPIAPVIVSFQLNTDYFNRSVASSFGQSRFDNFLLDCWNGQTTTMNFDTAQFDDRCIYFNKGDYQMTLIIDYTNTPTWERSTERIDAWVFQVKSEILVTPVGWTLSFNDARTEMIVGKAPNKVRFDASSVFRDFSLMDYRIVWDADSDWIPDKQDASTFTYTYNQARLYPVSVTFPDITTYAYVFPLRVEQSDVPVCDISFTNNLWSSYSFALNFLEANAKVVEYQYLVLDGKKTIYSTKSKQTNFDYDFSSPWTYSLKVDFITDEGKKWSCESDDIDVWNNDFQINYALKYKSPWSSKFVPFADTWSNSMFGDSVIISEMPTIIQLTLLSISPNTPGATKKVLLNWTPVLSSDWNKTFEFAINSSEEQTVSLVVEDPSTSAKSEKNILIGVNRDVIIGKLLVSPDSVWISPFEVTFDASTTTLNDSKDEIIYFTWDFGDGTEIKRNMSQAIIKHTYLYSQKEDQWIFNPKVTITTRKGIKKDILLWFPIIVKKDVPKLSFLFESHPGQIARVWDRVPVSLILDWLPDKVFWDFWNGKKIECDWRACISTSTVYDVPGSYTIRAKVLFSNKPEAEWNINIKIIN